LLHNVAMGEKTTVHGTVFCWSSKYTWASG